MKEALGRVEKECGAGKICLGHPHVSGHGQDCLALFGQQHGTSVWCRRCQQSKACDFGQFMYRGRGKNALGRVKKGGGGGKFTWGTLMSVGMDRNASPVLDRNDPNYESDAETGLLRAPSMQSQPVKRYKEAVCLIL